MANLISLTDDNIPELVTLHGLCFSKPWSHTFFQGIFANNTTLAYGHRYNAKLVSCIIVQGAAGSMDVLTLCCNPDYRRRFYATNLLKKVADSAQTINCQEIFLDVKNNNLPIISLYQKFGFKTISIRKNYYTELCGKSVDSLTMSLSIHKN